MRTLIFLLVLSGAGSVAAQTTNQPNAYNLLPPGLLPAGANFDSPAENTCNSAFDRFYKDEPGVYAYWPLCETTTDGSTPAFMDYLNRYDWNVAKASGAGGTAWTFYTVVNGSAAGPVPDGETAATVSTAAPFMANQDIVLNTNGGTIAAWIRATADSQQLRALGFDATTGSSGVSLQVTQVEDKTCFFGYWANAAGTQFTTPNACYAPDTWHRVVLTWMAATATLYVDGVPTGSVSYSGTFDNSAFYYSIFPQAGWDPNPFSMSLAKALISNQAWAPPQAAADYAPTFPPIPSGGVLVTTQPRGTIHRDVLGYSDFNANLLDPTQLAGLQKGLAAAGITTLRYANGGGGINADDTDWHPGASVYCGSQPYVQSAPGQTEAPYNTTTGDTVDTYLPQIAQPLGLDVVYTVNYGSNPPSCDEGGDPVSNGADLVAYLNKTQGYGVKYFEIGNELFDSNAGGLETDLHVQPYATNASGATYATYETDFYSKMKAVDPGIKIGVPIGVNNDYAWIQDWTLPVLGAGAYDAVIYHDYPAIDPVTDGSTLYPERIASTMDRSLSDFRTIQTMLLNAGKPADLWVTEWDSMTHAGGMWTKQNIGAVQPLYIAMRLAEYMNFGVSVATYWAQSTNSGCSPYYAMYDHEGDSSYAWWSECSNNVLVYSGPVWGELPVGLKSGDLYPAGHAFQLLSQSGFVTEGEHMLKTYADPDGAPWLAAYGATHGSGYALILVNRDRDAAHMIPVQIGGMPAGGSVQQWTYGKTQYDLNSLGLWNIGPAHSFGGSWSGTYNATLPSWSVSVLLFQ